MFYNIFLIFSIFQTNLEVDWDGSPRNHTCYTPKKRLNVRLDLQPLETCDDIPPNYTPKHFCMNYSILYNTSIPTAGSHRPLWPVFGEYRFVPPQRWLHSIEVRLLYHVPNPDINYFLHANDKTKCMFLYINKILGVLLK